MASLLGATVRLACTLRSDHNVGLHSIYWYQQRPGHPPRFLLRYFSPSDKKQGHKVPPRFSGSKDLAKNTGYLSIAELQAEDEAVYFCAVGTPVMGRRRKIQSKVMTTGLGGLIPECTTELLFPLPFGGPQPHKQRGFPCSQFPAVGFLGVCGCVHM